MDRTKAGYTPLLDRLTEYGGSDYYPFHMPGHKRQEELGITSFPNPFSVDITEIDGFDNLHHAEGILKESMERAAALYGSDRTYFMVNGSTGGILSAICGLTSPGGKILMARNSHKAAYHAVLLNQLDPVYIYPDFVPEFGIQGGISPEGVEAALRENEAEKDGKIQAVFLTSPTYEGMVSDVETIADMAHRYGIPLIVDEAHGAHFSFGGGFPRSALECGADVVIQSLHKTLPSLTQTAVLHIRGRLVDAGRMERYLSIFQSSSPSYVFLASIENCIDYMGRQGKERMRQFSASLNRFMEQGASFQNIRLIDDKVCGSCHIKDRDPSKIVVFTGDCGLTGAEAAKLLRSRFHLEPEMACGSYVLLMTSLMDTEEGFLRLLEALRYLDELAGSNAAKEASDDMGAAAGGGHRQRTLTWLTTPVKELNISEAWKLEPSFLNLEEAVGMVSCGFITVYPPGVPMIVPGERITGEAVELIRKNKELKLTVEGVLEDQSIAVSLIGKEDRNR